jgi:hypothetical protein
MIEKLYVCAGYREASDGVGMIFYPYENDALHEDERDKLFFLTKANKQEYTIGMVYNMIRDDEKSQSYTIRATGKMLELSPQLSAKSKCAIEAYRESKLVEKMDKGNMDKFLDLTLRDILRMTAPNKSTLKRWLIWKL